MRLKEHRQRRAAERCAKQIDMRTDMLSLPAADRDVSIIIGARNNAAYLRETIESALDQSVPCEVIYSDDCSSDDSVAIARSFGDRVTVLPGRVQLGVCAARNRGAEVSRGKYLNFLDGDDRMPPTFIADHLLSIRGDAATPFVYGPARVIGDHELSGHVYQVPAWCDYDKWQQNTCNTSSMYARWAFAAAGGWREDSLTCWDWDLVLRASRFGTPKPSTATLDYRYHANSWSTSLRENNDPSPYLPWVRRLNLRLSVCVVFSGRLPGLIAEWSSRLAGAIAWARLAEPVELVVVDNSVARSRSDSPTAILCRELARYERTIATVRIVSDPFRLPETYTEKERRDHVAGFLASASNRLLELASGDVVWFVEDDILVPKEGCHRLLNELTNGLHPPHAVAGAYRNRHTRTPFVCGTWEPSAFAPTEWETLPTEPTAIDVAGTGCLMFWKDRPKVPREFASHVNDVPAHDWAWCRKLQENRGELVLVPNVVCRHAMTETEFV